MAHSTHAIIKSKKKITLVTLVTIDYGTIGLNKWQIFIILKCLHIMCTLKSSKYHMQYFNLNNYHILCIYARLSILLHDIIVLGNKKRTSNAGTFKVLIAQVIKKARNHFYTCFLFSNKLICFLINYISILTFCKVKLI